MPAESRIAGPTIGFDRVTKRYPGGQVAIDSVTLTIAAGSFVALVGASGSGKSTLLKTVNRLIQPSEGTVTLGNVNVSSEEPYRLRRRIGYVFQNVGLFPHMSVAENIAIGIRIDGRRGDSARIDALLDLVDLPHETGARYPDALSGGQRQRVGVARALATEPAAMLLDEPFGALDPITRDQLGRAVRDVHDRLSLTTVMVTHDMAEALLLADRVLVMSAGRIVADAAPVDLIAGKGGPEADALVAVPREQAQRLNALAART